MNEFRITPLVLVTTVLISGFALVTYLGSFNWLTTIGGIVVLLILFSYDRGEARSSFQSVAFGAVSALPLVLAIGILLQRFGGSMNRQIEVAIVWLCATVVLTAIDLGRMNARSTQQPLYPVSPPMPVTLASNAAPVTQAAAEPVYELSQPVPEPVSPQPIREPEVSPAASEPFATEPAEQPIAPANPAAVTTIHVNMIGQGISILRPVQAEHLTRDIYRIVEAVPEGERWKYETGQAVRCRKQKLSSGKALVAFEEVILQRVN
ncbi:MAG TPA: hypothetical protein VN633_11410 [Bryobacteraceae bacterium]|nr:hypothetical protein [Bryobacteraceae bacterium]